MDVPSERCRRTSAFTGFLKRRTTGRRSTLPVSGLYERTRSPTLICSIGRPSTRVPAGKHSSAMMNPKKSAGKRSSRPTSVSTLATTTSGFSGLTWTYQPPAPVCASLTRRARPSSTRHFADASCAPRTNTPSPSNGSCASRAACGSERFSHGMAACSSISTATRSPATRMWFAACSTRSWPSTSSSTQRDLDAESTAIFLNTRLFPVPVAMVMMTRRLPCENSLYAADTASCW